MNATNATNKNNQFIIDQFINYYNFIYSSDTGPAKTKYYRLQSIKKAIEIIANFKKTIISGASISNISGIGKKTIERVDEIIQTGILSEITYKQERMKSIEELTNVYGIGTIKANELFTDYNIKSVSDLVQQYKQGKINLSEQIKLGIKYYDKLLSPIPRHYIESLNDEIQTLFNKSYTVQICGSFRREKSQSSDVDILVTHKHLGESKIDSKKYLHYVVSQLKTFFIIDDLTTNYTSHFMGYGNITWKNKTKNIVRVDIIIVPQISWYCAQLHFTGSATFNQKIRFYAKKLGYVLNEYGLFKGDKRIKINSENDIFDELMLKYVPPNKR